MQKQLVTVLQLDDKAFKSNLNSNSASLKAFSAAATAIGAAIAYAAKQTADYQDKVNDVAKSVGATTREISSLNVVARLNGSSTESMQAALTSLSGPTDKVAKKIEGLGINMRNADGSFKNSTQLLSGIAEKMAGLKSPADKAYMATRIFGSGELVQSLEQVAGGFDSIASQAERMGMLVSQDAANAAAKFNDDLDELQMSAEGLTHSIMTSVIAFANQSGAIQAASSMIQGAIKWWAEMDGESKNMIITIGAVGIAVGVLTGVIMVAGAAFAAVSAPVLIAAAALAAVAVVGLTVAENWDQMQDVIDPLRESFGLLKRDLISMAEKAEDAVKPLVDAAKSMMGIGSNTDEAGKKVSVFATIVKVVMGAIGLNIDIGITAFRSMTKVISETINALMSLGEAAGKALLGDFDGAAQAAEQAFTTMATLRRDLTLELDAFKLRAQEAFDSNPVISVDNAQIKAANEEAEKLNRTLTSVGDKPGTTQLTAYQQALKNAQQPFNDFSSEIAKTQDGLGSLGFAAGNVLQSIADSARQVVDAFAAIGEQQLVSMNQKLAKTNHQWDVWTKLRSKQMQEEIDNFKRGEDERIKAIKASEDAKLKAMDEAERAKIDLLKYYERERQLADEAEYQRQKAAKEAAFENYKLAERAKFEFDLALLNEKDLTEQERRVTIGAMEDNWKKYLQTLEAEHLTQMSTFQSEYQTTEEAKDNEFKAKLTTAEQTAAAKKEQAAAESAAKVSAIQEASAAKYEAMQKRKEAEEKAHSKAVAYINWVGQSAQLEVQKRIQVAQTIAAGLSGAAQALSSPLSIMTGGVAGIALAALITKSTAMAVQNISRQIVLPPAELFMATGGVVQGASHANGGIRAELEHNEAVISASKTRKIEQFIDAGVSRGGGQSFNVIFEKGSITGERNFDERWMDQLGDRVIERVRRRGIGALAYA